VRTGRGGGDQESASELGSLSLVLGRRATLSFLIHPRSIQTMLAQDVRDLMGEVREYAWGAVDVVVENHMTFTLA